VTFAPAGADEREAFGLTANPDGYVPSAAIEQVMENAMAALDAGRVPVIAGPTGLGKTLVLQLLARARADRSRPLYIPFCTLAPEELAALAVGLLDRAADGEPEAQLLAEARALSERGESLLLLVDDAAALPGETAAQLAHWRSASGGALQIVLAGLPGPALRHARDAFGDRAQELLLVDGLTPEELPVYVRSRLEAVAAGPELCAAFDDSALSQLARVSEGNPRRVNLAAQAIVRHAQGMSEPPPAASTQELPSTAQDLLNVGEYRFVRGHFVDSNGEPIAVSEPLPYIEETAPLAPRPAAPAWPPTLEPDALPPGEPEPAPHAPLGDLGEREARLHAPLEVPPEPRADPEPPGAFAVFNRDLPPEQAVQPPRSSRGLRLPLSRAAMAWLGGAAALTFFAIGVATQLGDEEPPALAIERAKPAAKTAPERVTPVRPLPVPADAEESVREPAAPVDAEVATNVPPLAEEAAPPLPSEEVPVESEVGSAALLASPVEPAPPPEPEPIAPPPAETIAVAINATPWAIIEIDGEEIGETPLAGIQLTTGRHRFRARMPDGSSRERVIRIDADTTTVVFE
jgi:type II secretory pathway predicted ATPase ExeA